MGPFLFDVFINHRFFIHNDVIIYNYPNDNCNARKDTENIKSVLERYIQNLLDFFQNNSFEANPSKFQRLTQKTFIVDNHILNVTADMTILGMNIDSKLNCNSHVSTMCDTAGTLLNVL